MPEQTFLPVRDSKLQGTPEFAQSSNYGSATSLRHAVLYNGGTKTTWERSIVDFDVSVLAGELIVGARLVREITSVASAAVPPVRLSRCTRPDEWVESEVTWLQYKSGSDWSTVGGDFEDAGPPASVTYNEPITAGIHAISGLVPFVEDAIANRNGTVSLISRLADEDPDVDTAASWEAKGVPDAWRLVVEYGPPDSGRRTTPRRASSGPSRTPHRPKAPAHATKPTTTSRPRRSFT